MLPKFVEIFNIFTSGPKPHSLGRARSKSESRLKACFVSTVNVGRTPQLEEPNPKPTREGMGVGRKCRLAETQDLRDLLEGWKIPCPVVFGKNATGPGEHTGIEEYNLIYSAKGRPLTNHESTNEQWQRATFTRLGRLSTPAQRYT